MAVIKEICYVNNERVVIPAQEFPVQGTTRHYLGVVNTPLLAWHSDRRKIIYFFSVHFTAQAASHLRGLPPQLSDLPGGIVLPTCVKEAKK